MNKTLTQKQVKKLSLNKVSVITADMLDGYTTIGESAFHGCSNLTSIEIPNSVTSIGSGAFWNCSGLTSITIPNSVTSIGDTPFAGCGGLTSPIYNAHVFAFMPTSYSGAYTIPDGIESIAGGAFYNCSNLTSVTIPHSVTSIGFGAFQSCSSLTSIEIPNNTTNIREWAFNNCSCLTLVIIGDKTYEKQIIIDGKCKAYKGFNADMTCRNFRYEEGKTYKLEGNPKLCERGFHACLNLLDVFNYYCGEIGKDIVIHEVVLENVSDECNTHDTKVVAKKITIGKRIL